MRTSEKGIQIIKDHEDFRSEPYLCPAGVPTIGYGATYYPNGIKVTLDDAPISKNVAENLLKEMIKSYENAVNRYVQWNLNQNQFDALVSFTYNVGKEAFRTSTLLKKINQNPFDKNISYQFSRWNKSNGKVLGGLVKRRKQEAELYFS